MQTIQAPDGATRMWFETLEQALAWRAAAGGWIFAAPAGPTGHVASAQWFDASKWTPSKIITETRGIGSLL